jgi:hypothetical protein
MCVIIGDGVWNSEAMDNGSEEEYRLIRFNSYDQPSLNPLQELVNSDK